MEHPKGNVEQAFEQECASVREKVEWRGRLNGYRW